MWKVSSISPGMRPERHEILHQLPNQWEDTVTEVMYETGRRSADPDNHDETSRP